MIVVNAGSIRPDNRSGVQLKTLFEENAISGGKTKFGIVTIPPGARIPLRGSGVHQEDEYSIIIKGAIIAVIGDEEYHLSAGDATLIPAGEEHWAYNPGKEDCEIVWALVRKG